jgi:hypothetical protein
MKTHFMFNNVFSENLAVYERAGQATDDNITRRMRFACQISQATNTHSEYVIPIAFPTATMVVLTHLIVTFYVQNIWLYCYEIYR